MIKIKDIYEYFSIPQPLQQHMIDVASVGMMIIDYWEGPVLDRESILQTLLLHDLGNLVKIDFNVHGEYYHQNLEYRKTIKSKIIEQYGKNCHDATVAMIQSLGDFPQVISLIQTMGIEKHLGVHLDHEAHIVDYADARVSINGVCSLEERLCDVQQRYQGKFSRTEGVERDNIYEDAHRVEQQIYSYCSIDAQDITHSSTRKYAQKLWDFELENVSINTRLQNAFRV